jgi:hypothetical protein
LASLGWKMAEDHVSPKSNILSVLANSPDQSGATFLAGTNF